MVVGFSVGTLFILLQRLLAGVATTPTQRNSSGEKTEEEEDAVRQPHSVQPGAVAEPGPEPLPGHERLQRVPVWKGRLQTAAALCVAALAISLAMWGHDACAETGDCREEGAESNEAAATAAAAAAAVATDLSLDGQRLDQIQSLSTEAMNSHAGGAETQSQVTDGMDAASITLPLVRQVRPIEVVNDVVYHRSVYWGKIAVGNPAVNFTVAFDTGSGHVVLPSAYCKTSICRSRTRYKRSASRSAIDINHDGVVVQPKDARDHITVSFGTGEVSGVFVEEIVCVGPEGIVAATNLDRSQVLSLPAGCVTMRIILATAMSDDPFKHFKFDGVFGLGLQGLSQAAEFNFPSVMTNAFRQWGSLHPYIFAVYLGQGDKDQSEITLGGYDPRRASDGLVWNHVVQPELGQWMLQIRSIRIDGKPLPYCKDGCRGICDTGTSLLTVPSAIFQELTDELQHDAPPSGPCNRDGPQLQIDLDEITLTLDPSDYAHRHSSKPKWEDDDVQFSTKEHGNITRTIHVDQCKPMLMTMDFPEPMGPRLFILGEPILKKYYTVYSARDPPKIAFSSVSGRTNDMA